MQIKNKRKKNKEISSISLFRRLFISDRVHIKYTYESIQLLPFSEFCVLLSCVHDTAKRFLHGLVFVWMYCVVIAVLCSCKL